MGCFEEMAEKVHDMERLYGATWTKRGFQAGYNDAWSKVLEDVNKYRLTIFFTHGNPSEGQEPCDQIQIYLNDGIEVIAIAVGQDAISGIQECNLDIQIIPFDDFTSSTETLATIFEINSCSNFAGYAVNTPFNGKMFCLFF